MSRGGPHTSSTIPVQPKTRKEDLAHDSSSDQEAANTGANISTYDDPPLDQLDETEDGSFSVEENAWRGEDPPEEVPHDEYAGSEYEYEEDMPDDEMASRTGEGHQETISDKPLDESHSEDPTHTSECVDARGALRRHQGDTSTIGTEEGGDDEEGTQFTQGSRSSRGTRGSLAASLKERYRGKRSPGIRMPPSSPTDDKSGTSIGASSANSQVNGISVDTPRFSDEDGYNGVNSPGFSDNTSTGEFERTDDGYYYQENGRRRREGDTAPFSEEEGTDDFASPRSESQFSPHSDEFASHRSESQFSPQSDFTGGDELMSPLGSPTGQAHDQALQQPNNNGAMSPTYELGESPQASQPSPGDAGSYTDGSYTTDASSMMSADANPSTRRALILQMAKARMNSGKRREQAELEENGTDPDADTNSDDDSEIQGETDGGSMARKGQIIPGDAVEIARANSPGGSVDDFEGVVTGDLD